MKWNCRKFLRNFGWLIGSILSIVLIVQYNNIKKDYINLNDIVDYSIEDGILTIEIEEIHNSVDRPYKTIEEYVVKRDMI